MTAMGVDHFVVTLVDAKLGKQEERRWCKAEVIKSMRWLKRMNARGYDVWIRPDGDHALVLLGGLKRADLQILRERGFTPAAVVEASREQYQAWVKLSQRPLDESLRGDAVEGLVQGLGRYGANAISRDDGRIAGFTNQQVLRASGRHPYVTLTEWDGTVALAASAYLDRLKLEYERNQEARRDETRERHHSPQR